MAERKTSGKVGKDASEVLRDGRTASESKSSAGSALSQRKAGRATSDSAASAASDTLQDKDTGKKSKAAAGSTLSQKKK